MTNKRGHGQIAIGSNIVQADRGGKASLTVIQQTPLQPIPAVPPSPSKYFTGRKQHLSDIVAAITTGDVVPIVAILGMGGIGKTALVKQVAQEVKSKFPGGIFWGDELPPNDSNPSIILKQWGRICGQTLEKESEENLPSVVRGLLAAYQSKFGSVLVVIDDIRLDWKDDGVSVIMQALPHNVPLLITTRQTQIAQELGAKVFSLDVFSRDESIQLLVALSDGKIHEVQANKIAELCGDMPLALELLAKLAKRRKSDWLLERLQGETNRLNILKLDDAFRKEQSVKISFSINYQSLEEQHPESARIFRYLAAFAKPTFIIFEHLAKTLAHTNENEQRFPTENLKEGYKRITEDELLRLVDWSLLAEESIEGSEMQYFRMHTLLHEYAQSHLTDTVEVDEAVCTHIKYCVAFAETNPQLDLQKHNRSTLEFEKSYGQLLQALKQIKDRYINNGAEWENLPELARQIVPLVSAMDNHWQWHSQFTEQVEWLQLAYRCAGMQKNNIKQADFARRIGRALSWQGKLDDASMWMDLCKIALGEENASEEALTIRALMCIHSASISYQRDDLDTAEEACICGVTMVDEKRYPRIYAEGYNILGAINMKSGKLNSALEAFEKSLLIWRQVGDQYQIYRVDDNVRTALYYLGDITQLRKAEEDSQHYWEQFQNRIELAMALTNRGLVLYIDEEHEAAIELQKRAIEISDLLLVQRMRALTRVNIAWPYMALEKYDEAEKYLKKSLEIQENYDIEEYRIDAMRCLAEVELGRTHFDKAIELGEEALELATAEDDPLEIGAALRTLGETYHLNGDFEKARRNLESSLSKLRDNGYKYESYLTLQVLSKLYVAIGDVEEAQIIADEERSLSMQMGLNLSRISSQ